jgi:hypothetical protein
MKRLVVFPILILLCVSLSAQLKEGTDPNVICGHRIQRDGQGKILAWYKPDIPGEAYAHVAQLASEFILLGTPVDLKTGKKIYFISCCFEGPHMRSQEEFDRGETWRDWMHNPACVWAGLVQGLVLDYRVFSGDDRYVDTVRRMLDHQLDYGTTPDDWPWANCPYASSDPGETVYQGATRWEHDGMRGDGLHGIEPDKIGELGIAYLKFFEVTEEKRYLDAAIHCADALAKHVRDVVGDPGVFSRANTERSPWPFRVNARTGVVISEYSSNVIEPIRLFDELKRIRNRIGLSSEQIQAYQKARDLAWNWLYSKNGPMKTFIWNAYFEDIPNDSDRSNRVQITPLETARYLLKNPQLDPNLDQNVSALIRWVASAFGTDGMDAIKEQTWCYEPMGSHTARYASLCALMYERTGEEWYRDQAFRFFNFATYMTYDNGVVAVGPRWPGSWFSDGYGDYIRHFMEGMAANPKWAPADRDHLLRSSSVVQTISYGQNEIRFKTFDPAAEIFIRLTSSPKRILVDGKELEKSSTSRSQSWSWTPLEKGGVVQIYQVDGREVLIVK